MNENKISENIRKKRTEIGITQEELANTLGVTKAAVSKWETGDSYPDITLIPHIASFFRISLDELFSFQFDNIDNFEKKTYDIGLYMSQLADTLILDYVTINKSSTNKHFEDMYGAYYDTTILGFSDVPDFLDRLQKALKPGIYNDVIETITKNGITERFHCWVCTDGIFKFHPGDKAGIKVAVREMRNRGIIDEDEVC